MADSKPYASLSSGLLARKGGAKPAMRPQGFNSFGGSLEDLGWNDMGPTDEYEHHTATQLGLTPAPRSHLHVAPSAEAHAEEAPPEEARLDEEPLDQEP